MVRSDDDRKSVVAYELGKEVVHAIGVGETAEDLQPFEARDFAQALVGSNQPA